MIPRYRMRFFMRVEALSRRIKHISGSPRSGYFFDVPPKNRSRPNVGIIDIVSVLDDNRGRRFIPKKHHPPAHVHAGQP